MPLSLIHTTKHELIDLINRMAGLRAIVIGDAMVDHYIHGSVHRISPEAPVPVVQHKNEEYRLGGAANVVHNLAALGAEATLFTVIGRDQEGDIFVERLRQISPTSSGLQRSLTRPTTVKTRIIGNGQQVLRIDREESSPISSDEVQTLLGQIDHFLTHQKPDVIIFEDYDKGVITEQLIHEVVKRAKDLKIPVVVDPKKRNMLFYRNVSLLKPNFKELCDAVPWQVEKTEASLKAATAYLRETLGHKYTLVTLSEHGAWIDSSTAGSLFSTRRVQVSDVSGAGDTVMSIVALGICLTENLEQIALLANLAGGQVCEKPGVVPIDKSALITEILMN